MKYSISVEVRNKKHRLYQNKDGFKVTGFAHSVDLESKEQIERYMRNICIDYQAISKDNSVVNIEALVYNAISGTWMTMYSYYGSEDRFIIH